MEMVVAASLLSVAEGPAKIGEATCDAAELLEADAAEEFTVTFENTTASALRFIFVGMIPPVLRRILASLTALDKGKAVAFDFVITPR